MSAPGAGGGADWPAYKLFQPEVSAFVQRVRAEAVKELEGREAQVALNLEKLEEEKKSFEQAMEIDRQKMQREYGEHTYRMKWERENFEQEKREFYEAQSRGSEMSAQQDIVTVEVGGEKFRTLIHTLAKCRGSVFPKLVTPLNETKAKRDPYIFIDRDGRHFRFILNYLREGEKVMRWPAMRNVDLCTLNEIIDEVSYYKIAGLEKLLKVKMASLKDKLSFEILAKVYFQQQRGRYQTTKNIEIKDCNLTGVMFSKVDFHHPLLFDSCVMRAAKFVECHFKNTVTFSNVDVYGVSFVRCGGANLHAFEFKDTKQSDIKVDPLLTVP